MVAISVVYADILVQPWAISGGKYLVVMKIATYLCRWKRVQNQRVLMPGHALFWAMDNFFRWIVNFSEQSFVRKVAAANFAAIAERQIALPLRLRLYPPHTYPTAQEWADSLWFDLIRSNNWRTTPKVCAWNSQPDAQDLANPIGVRVHTRHLHRCRCLCSSVTLMAVIDTPTSYTQ